MGMHVCEGMGMRIGSAKLRGLRNMGNGKLAVIAALGVFTLVVPALAQDVGAVGNAAAIESANGDASEVRTDARGPAAVEEATRTLPKWESYGGGTDPNSLDETFFRLAQDFVSTSDLGVRRLGSVPIWPRGELKFGKVRILPYLREAVEWDTNFYRRPRTGYPDGSNRGKKGRQTGWTQVNQVGALADVLLNGGRTRISLSVDQTWNVRYRQDQPDTWENMTQLGVSHKINEALWTSVGYGYERRTDPTELQQTRRFERTTNRLFARLGMNRDLFFGSRLNYEVGIDVRDVRGKQQEFEDDTRRETTGYAKVSYPFWKRTTRIFGTLTYRNDNRDSERLNDGNVWGWDMGMQGSIPLSDGGYRGLRGQVSVGFQTARYDNGKYNSGNDQLRTDSNDSNTNLSVNAALQYIMSPRTTMDLRYIRTNQFSYTGNYQIVDRIDYTLSHNITPKLVGRFQTFYEISDPSGKRGNDNVDGERVNGQSRYKDFKRGGVGIGFRYPVQDWVDLDLSFDWEKRVSDQTSSYSNVRGIFGVTFYFSGLNAPKQTFLDF